MNGWVSSSSSCHCVAFHRLFLLVVLGRWPAVRVGRRRGAVVHLPLCIMYLIIINKGIRISAQKDSQFPREDLDLEDPL